ncbi:hydrolase [Oceanobacillus oncorhynchi subsp. incaldanensis]|uniref:alpha/beta fold hydrolase n=1 Tax=Oceanobacillus oncorhynchi TaxID=545501 RepID=UPI001B19E0AA|nr:alpha/beta hydrolase [Oceanobacillus oncorhynchi]GIO20267.1 hydrolase [Oceanobacillus oncorhynchi subsp. incaldanensis]
MKQENELDRNKKIPLLLLPGTLCNEKLWEHQIAYLEDIASITVGDLTQNNTIEGMASSVLDKAPEKFALAGLSLGGMVAIEMMRQAPERVTQLALLDTNPRPPTDAQIETWHKFIRISKEGDFISITKDYLMPGLLRQANQGTPLVQTVINMAEEVGANAMERQMTALMHRPDAFEVLPTIQCSVSVMVGDEDNVCPIEMSNELIREIPNSYLTIIKDAGHLSSLENPLEVSRTMRQWLIS